MNKNLAIVLGIVAVLLAGGGIVWYTQNQGGTGNTAGSQPYGTAIQGANGKVVFSITDAAASMQDISSVQMTVSKVELHSAAQGWITVSTETKKFDLLELKATGKLAVATTADIAAGTYNQIRLQVDKVIVVQSGATKEAKLPSGELKINGDVKVESGSTASVKLDFLVDKSLHLTGKGEFVFAPVIKVESRSRADVRVDSDGSVSVQGGVVNAEIDIGMDTNGEMKNGFMLKTDANIEIDGGVIKLKGSSE